MCQWSSTVASHWGGQWNFGTSVPTAGDFSLVINPRLIDERRAIVMVNANGSTYAASSPSIAYVAGVAPDSLPVSLGAPREALSTAGV